MPRLKRFPRLRGEDLLIGGLLIVVAFASPLIGGVIAGLFANQAHQNRDFVRRNICLVAVGVALLMLILVSFLPGTYSRLFLSIYG